MSQERARKDLLNQTAPFGEGHRERRPEGIQKDIGLSQERNVVPKPKQEDLWKKCAKY